MQSPKRGFKVSGLQESAYLALKGVQGRRQEDVTLRVHRHGAYAGCKNGEACPWSGTLSETNMSGDAMVPIIE